VPNRTEAVRHILATVFAAQNALRALAPEYRWTGLGNLLGDYGEFLAIDHYGLTKADAGSSGYDALTPEGKTVQIKTNHASQTIGIRGEADLLLVLKVQTALGRSCITATSRRSLPSRTGLSATASIPSQFALSNDCQHLVLWGLTE